MKSTLPIALALCTTFLVGCTHSTNPGDATPISTQGLPHAESRAGIASILDRHGVDAASVGIMRDFALVSETFAGTERPGVPVDAETRFEIASVTKTIITETTLRLVDKGLFDLDEPLATYWVDPDVADAPELGELTARHVLSHRTGFPNWRFFRSDGKLTFENPPGTRYGYSGEGSNYLGRALENKLGKSFPAIVEEHLFAPLGVQDAELGHVALEDDFAMLRDKDGKLYDKHCRPGFCFPQGGWSAAGGLAISLRDYAKILAAIGRGTGYGPQLREERAEVISGAGDSRLVHCEKVEPEWCPLEQGYGLGFQIARYADRTTIGHSGDDWSTLSVAYVDPQNGDGLIVFLTGQQPSVLPAMVELLEAIDPNSPYLPRYRSWLDSLD